MAAISLPPSYSGLPPPYSHSLSATRSHNPPDEVGLSARLVLRALPTSDAASISRTSSSIVKGPNDLLDAVEKELAKVARSRHEDRATNSSTAEVQHDHGTLRSNTHVAGFASFSLPSVGMFRNVCSTDLLFLIDTTTSMQGYINAAKSQVEHIVDSVNKSFFGQAEVRTAIVGYKDHSDNPNIEFLDFTTSVEQVHTFLARLRASGGFDVPEDVLGGLRQALNATWLHQTRCIIHIADAPPHGVSLQNSPIDGDSYPDPGSEPHGLTYEPILSRMIGLNINYALLRINNSTDRMAYAFAEAYATVLGKCKLLASNQYFSSSSRFTTTDGRTLVNSESPAGGNGLLFEEFELGTAYDKLQHLVVKIVTASASQTTMRVLRKRRIGKVRATAFTMPIDEEEDTVNVSIENGPPQWSTKGWLDETLELEGFSPDMGVYSESTLNDMMSSDDNIKISPTQLTIRKRSRPFAQGTVRTASYACTASSTNQFVVKAFKERGKAFGHLVEDMRGQALCKAFALEFNALTGSSNQIDFIVTTCLKGEGKIDIKSDNDCMSLEPYISGKYVKYNSNRGWVNKDAEDQLNQLAQAFSHFSFERSRGQFMITDLQGVGHTLTDPSIHTRDPERFGSNHTNLGVSGFMFFFQTHECNIICRKLGLESNATMFESEAWKWPTWPELDTTVCCSNKLCSKIVDRAKKSNKFPGFSWCYACWPQLTSSKVTCVAEGYSHHTFKAHAFFLESQGQKVPRKCSKHCGR